MNILWISNIEFPEATKLLSKSETLKKSGGWMLGAANALLESGEIKSFVVATVSRKVNKLTCLQGGFIKYYLIPYGKGNTKYNKDYEAYWLKIKDEVNPDIIHIHGTEFSHGLAYVNACGSEGVVVSIQGMKSAYYYYYYGLTVWNILRNLTFHDLITGSILNEQKSFKKQSEYEIALLKNVHHIIGRTSWDRARTWAINPEAEYHFCNETLRSEFYQNQTWDYSVCRKHTIFCSQATYPIKGLHQLLKALPLVLRHYPDTIVRVAGADITQNKGIWGVKHFTGYGKILKKLIRKHGLSSHVEFLGPLDAKGMCQEYLKCNVFVLPSTIENSPNSLGEAQVLGVPVISSYVGGAMDMMRGLEDNLYRFEEIEMLAYKICEIFDKKEKQKRNITSAIDRHNPSLNANNLIDIYKKIIKNE